MQTRVVQKSMPVLNHQKASGLMLEAMAPEMMGPTMSEMKYMEKYSVWYLPRSCRKMTSAMT